MFLYRTRGEEAYVTNLGVITDNQIEAWRGQRIINPAAYGWTRPQIHVDFRFIKKGLSSYWHDDVRPERKLRSSHGWFMPWHLRHQGAFRHRYSNRVFVPVTDHWKRFEVPRNCYVELPPIFTYKPQALRDEDSGWWVVAYTEHAAKVAAFTLFEAYDLSLIHISEPTRPY